MARTRKQKIDPASTAPDKCALFSADGDPLNLPAAAYDALDWLDWFVNHPRLTGLGLNDADLGKLAAARRELYGFLFLYLPARNAPAQRRRSGAVVVIEGSSRLAGEDVS